jgi:hypothetical protein
MLFVFHRTVKHCQRHPSVTSPAASRASAPQLPCVYLPRAPRAPPPPRPPPDGPPPPPARPRPAPLRRQTRRPARRPARPKRKHDKSGVFKLSRLLILRCSNPKPNYNYWFCLPPPDGPPPPPAAHTPRFSAASDPSACTSSCDKNITAPLKRFLWTF